MAALAANWLSKQEDHHAKSQTDIASRPPTVDEDDHEVVSSVRLTEGRVAIFVLFVGGILTLALESRIFICWLWLRAIALTRFL